MAKKHRDSLAWGFILIVWGASKIYFGLKDKAEKSVPPARDSGHEI
jgi:hypothetical protein